MSERFVLARITVVISIAMLVPLLHAQSKARPKSGPASQKQQNAPVTLGELRKRYEGKTVVVNGAVFQQTSFLEWDLAVEDGPRFQADPEHKLPISYRGREAQVVALQNDDLHERVFGRTNAPVNALGESVSDDTVSDPYTKIIVRFEDGTTAITTQYPSSFENVISLASARDSNATVIESNLKSIIGRPLYATAMSDIYEESATLDDLLDPLHGGSKQLADVPFLVPLTITTAKYFKEHDGVVLKLRLPDGRFGLTFNKYRTENWGAGKDTFVGRVAGFLEPEVPRKLTAREIAAIKQRAIFAGMSRDAVYYSLGVTLKENNWGRGGKQLIYGDNVYVYLDSTGKVTNWQSLHR